MTIHCVLHIVAPTVDFNTVIPESKLLEDGDTITAAHHHSSLGDASFETLVNIALQCDKVVFHPEQFDQDSELEKSTMLMLHYLSHRITIDNFSASKPFDTVNLDLSSSQDPCLWVFGCSHSYGVGLDHESQRYSNILAESLHLPLRLIAEPGSSLGWSLNHMIRSEIKSSDTVVWQITTPGRLSKYQGNKKILHTKIAHHPALLDFFSDDQMFFDHVNLLHQGVAFLRAKKVKFAMTSILPKDSDWFYTYNQEYVKFPEYCYTPDFTVDFGHDGVHAGPLSNKLLASSLHDHIQYING